jgi:hypothetical protein
VAELSDINQSGALKEINLDGLEVRKALADGVNIPQLAAADAANGAIFFNTDTGALSWKSPAGMLLRFRLRLEQ